GVNLRSLRKLQRQGVVVLHQEHDLEQDFRAVSKQGRPFTLDRSVLDGTDLLAGDEASEVQDTLGPNHQADFEHIYAASLNHSDFFITEYPREFIKNGKRKKLENLLRLKIRTTEEFLNDLHEN